MPAEAVDREMAAGRISSSLPFIHKEGVELLKKNYASRLDAETQLPDELRAYYRKNYFSVYNSQRQQIEQAAAALVYIYNGNVFPAMKVTWGTYPNNLGHMNFPGCFRCHGTLHAANEPDKMVPQDCNVCHNLLYMGEANPKILTDLGLGEGSAPSQ